MDPDDLGEGGDSGSLTTGNAGPRVDCCVITQLVYPDDGDDDDGVSAGGNGESGSEGGGGASHVASSAFVVALAGLVSSLKAL